MKITKEIKHKNGGVTLIYSLNKKEDKLLKGLAKEKKVKYTEKFINKCILEGIKNMLKEQK